jgi:branched-chain amino acid aminotransferase
MSLNTTHEIDIVKVPVSKIDSVDFDNIVFGNTFTDHMLTCDFRNGAWERPQIKPYAPFLLDPSAKVFHYGQAIFEGMKAYKDESDDVWLFRPDQNFERFNKSAVRMAMPKVPEEIFLGGLKEILKIEKDWVRKGKGNTLYIRPFMIAIGTGVVAAPSTQYRFMIILSLLKLIIRAM